MKMKTHPNDVSNQEILEALNAFAGTVDGHFDQVEGRLDSVEKRLNRVEAVMVTKDYLDDKLANLHSSIIQHTRKEIEKALR